MFSAKQHDLDVWIGLKRTNNGKFVWAQNVEVSFTNWATDEPKSHANVDVCVYFSSQNKWKTLPCDEAKSAYYVCEVESK